MTETAQLDRIEWPAWRIAIIAASGAFLSSIDAWVVAVGLDAIGAGQATAQVNIAMRVGGALGGALFAVALGAFHQTFWYLTATSLAATAAAVWLWSASTHARQSLIEGAS